MCRQPTENGNDITPRPPLTQRVKRSPPMPFRKRGRAQEGNEKDRASSTGFLGMKFRSSPRAHSSCAGVLGKDGRKGRPDWNGDFNNALSHSGGKGAEWSPSGARMAWLKTACRKTGPTNHPQRFPTANKAGGGMLLPSQKTCLDPSWPSSLYISAAAEFSGRLASACFRASPAESGSVRVTSGGVAYVTLDFVQYMGSLRSLFWSWRP